MQMFEDDDPTNTQKARTLGTFALNPVGNGSSDMYFLSLATGKQIFRSVWTKLPITDIAIACMEALAKIDKCPLIQEDRLVIEW